MHARKQGGLARAERRELWLPELRPVTNAERSWRIGGRGVKRCWAVSKITWERSSSWAGGGRVGGKEALGRWGRKGRRWGRDQGGRVGGVEAGSQHSSRLTTCTATSPCPVCRLLHESPGCWLVTGPSISLYPSPLLLPTSRNNSLLQKGYQGCMRAGMKRSEVIRVAECRFKRLPCSN